MEKVTIAKVVKPHGYKGAMKLRTETRDEIDYNAIDGVFIDENFYNIEDSFLAGGEVVLKLQGIDSLDAVNVLRRKDIKISKDYYLQSKEANEILVSELEDARVVLTDGQEIGNLISVENYGASDLIFIKSQKYTNLIVPNIDGLVISFENGVLVLDKKIFFEVKTHD